MMKLDKEVQRQVDAGELSLTNAEMWQEIIDAKPDLDDDILFALNNKVR